MSLKTKLAKALALYLNYQGEADDFELDETSDYCDCCGETTETTVYFYNKNQWYKGSARYSGRFSELLEAVWYKYGNDLQGVDS